MKTAESIFVELAGLAESERKAFLDRKCSGRPELRAEVERLLAEEQEFDDELRAAAGFEAERAVSHRTHIGPYRVTRRLGCGGMGAVYLAIRDDDEYHKQVAVKVARASTFDDGALRRFRDERQILAGLEHPNIARLLEGGTTQDGEPYIVMEYVAGATLLEHCQQRALDRKARLRLFLKIAEAVDHAHRQLILHRDLKPSNILVDGQGEPKLLDFGIARVLGSPDSSALTQTPRFTPDYSSPEQIAGKPESIPSDLYSLGLVLFEMLTGKPARRDCVGAALPADLLGILRKALREDPKDRYRSARDFADDVERFLHGHPVRARSSSSWYALGKFALRHRGAMAAAAAVLLMAGAGLWSTLREARRTQLRLAQVREMSNTMLFDLHDRIRDLPGSMEARAHIVETAQKYLGSIDPGGDPEVMTEIAAGYERLGDLQGGPDSANVGKLDTAIASYRKALALRAGLAESRSAAALRGLSKIQVKTAKALVQRGASAEALELLSTGLQNAEEAVRRGGPTDRESALAVIEAAHRLGDYLLAKGRASEAVPHAARGFEVAGQFQLPARDRWNSQRRLGEALHQAGRLAEAAEQFAAAARHSRSEGDSREKMLLEFAQGNVLGNPLYLNLGRVSDALACYRRGLQWAQAQVSLDPKNANARSDLAAALSKIGYTHPDPRQAAMFLDQAIAIRTEQLRVAPENVELIRVLAYYLANSADVERRAGRPAEAESRAKRAIAMDEEMVRRDPMRVECCSDIPLYAVYLGDAQWDLGRRADALASYQLAHKVAESYGGKPNCGVFCVKDWACSLEKLAEWHFRMGRKTEAAHFARRGREVWLNWSQRNGSNEYIERRLRDLSKLGA